MFGITTRLSLLSPTCPLVPPSHANFLFPSGFSFISHFFYIFSPVLLLFPPFPALLSATCLLRYVPQGVSLFLICSSSIMRHFYFLFLFLPLPFSPFLPPVDCLSLPLFLPSSLSLSPSLVPLYFCGAMLYYLKNFLPFSPFFPPVFSLSLSLPYSLSLYRAPLPSRHDSLPLSLFMYLFPLFPLLFDSSMLLFFSSHLLSFLPRVSTITIFFKSFVPRFYFLPSLSVRFLPSLP